MTVQDKQFYSRNADVVRDRILDAAETVFAADGYAGASTNAILARFGGSKATIFRHFATKRELLQAVVRRIGERLTALAAYDRFPDAPPQEWLARFGTTALLTILRDDALFVGRMVVAQGRNFPELGQTFTAAAVRPMLILLTERFREWDAAHLLVCPEPEADAKLYFDLVMSGWVARCLFNMDPVPDAALAEREAARAALLFLDGRRGR